MIWCIDPKGRGVWSMWLGEATINFWGMDSKENVGEGADKESAWGG